MITEDCVEIQRISKKEVWDIVDQDCFMVEKCKASRKKEWQRQPQPDVILSNYIQGIVEHSNSVPEICERVLNVVYHGTMVIITQQSYGGHGSYIKHQND
jgi:hypothetical protein